MSPSIAIEPQILPRIDHVYPSGVDAGTPAWREGKAASCDGGERPSARGFPSVPASREPRRAVPGVIPIALSAEPSTLPVQLTRFVGRSAELAEVRDLLGGTRLLTLAGSGGSGKTRLALEAARAAELEGGRAVWWVELAPLNDAAQLPQAVASVLRLVEEPGRPPLRALAEAIGRRPALLVLDNCEHVIEACALLCDHLLRACPALSVLATSRETLGVAGETAWLVPPLALPPAHTCSAEAVAGSEAVALFVERARGVATGFAISDANAGAVAGICCRLDGVPLAIELAAARAKVLTPAQILERLDDCFSLLVQRGRATLPRHQTIRATIDWSYDLLQPPKRMLLQRLSTFCAGFTLEAAERVCAGDGIEAREVLDLLSGLVERSLVVMREAGGGARYHLLEVVRQYAAERLAEEGAAAGPALARRHAEYFAAFADATGPGLEIVQAPEVVERVGAEHGNLRVALDSAVRAGDAALALRICGVLCPYWLHGTHWSEGVESITRVLDLARTNEPTAPLGRALLGAGSLAYALQDLTRARAWLQAAEEVWRALSDVRYLALVHGTLAQLEIHLGDADAALRLAQASVRYAREHGNAYVLTYTLSTALGFVHAFRGEAALADGFCAEAQQIALREGYRWGILVTSFSRAMTAWMDGDTEAAARQAVVCIGAARRVDNAWFEARVLLVPAAVAAHRGELARAARLLGACYSLQASRGARLLAVEQPYFNRIVEITQRGLDADAFACAWADGGRLGLSHALDEAEAVVRDETAACARRVPRPVMQLPAVPPAANTAAASLATCAELRIRALGPLEIVRGAELLGPEKWQYAKPRELLLYLLCHPDGAPKEQIGQAIWPDATPAQVRNSLHVTLHYVRKALGAADWIVFANDRYRLNRDFGVEFDLEIFEAEAATVLAERAVDDTRLRKVLACYRGDFLATEAFGAWHLELRDGALRCYVELVAALAEYCFVREDYREAKRLYLQAVGREELREDLQRRLMQCLVRTGERAQALRHAEGLIATLRSELDADPEPETMELVARARRAEDI
jgi:predicted ATPase/DNA-binding SARP family transcriptional activator